MIKLYNLKTQAILFVVLFFCFFPFYSQALTIGPVKIELTGDPGQELSGEFIIFNEGSETETYYPNIESYTEEDGEKKFAGEKKDLANWVQTAASVTLAAKEQKKVPFMIQLPKDAPAGSFFAVAWWGTGPPVATEGQKVSIVTRAGALMMININGDVDETGSIDTFLPAGGKKLIVSYLPQNFSVIFENKGTVYIKPSGSIEEKNILGIPQVSFSVNKVKLEVYPKTKKTLRVVSLSGKTMEGIGGEETGVMGFYNNIRKEWRFFGIGPYKAELNLLYGEESTQQIQSTYSFFVLPWRIMLFVFAILLIIFYVLTGGIKRYNRWIIKKSQR